MIKIVSVVLMALCLYAVPAIADSIHECQGNSCNGGGSGYVGEVAVKNTNLNRNTNVNVNTTSTEQNVSVNGTGGGVTDYPRQAPALLAPSLTVAPETCMGSAAGGVSTPFGGLTFGSTYRSDSCELRMFARSLQMMGYTDAALAILAQDERVVRALLDAGIRVPGRSHKTVGASLSPIGIVERP